MSWVSTFAASTPLGPYILDFHCAAMKLAVEVDGPVHQEQIDRDQRRTTWLDKEGITVIRFSVDDVEARSAAVLTAIGRVALGSTT